MIRRCVSIAFICMFCSCLLTLQHLYMLGSKRQRRIRNIWSRDEVVCGKSGCRNIEARELGDLEARKRDVGRAVRVATATSKRREEKHKNTYLTGGNAQNDNSKIRNIISHTALAPAEEEQIDPNTKYIFPVMFYNMGPNNLFRILKEAISLATLFNRTVVIPPFPHHPRMEKSDKLYDDGDELVEVDIFDQSYRSLMETDPERIVDVAQLTKLIPIASYKKFKQECGNRVHTTLSCGKVGGKRVEGLRHFHEATGVELGKKHEISQISDDDLRNSFSLNMLNAMRSTQDQQCVALALGHKCFGSRQSWLDFWTPKAKFYQRPIVVQDLANAFIKKTFDNEEYLSVHWRFENVDWLDMCKISRPSSVRKINGPICAIVEQIVYNRTFVNEISSKIDRYMKKKSLKFLYFAAPPQLNTALDHLQTKLSSMYYSKNVLDFAKSGEGEKWSSVFRDNFAASFLDQELCYKSSIFLGSPLSSWTQTVMLDRVSRGIFSHRSIFDVILEDSSKFPKLSWYFPEGN